MDIKGAIKSAKCFQSFDRIEGRKVPLFVYILEDILHSLRVKFCKHEWIEDCSDPENGGFGMTCKKCGVSFNGYF